MIRFHPARRTENLKPTIFSTMSRLAVEHGAVNLGQGFPDFDGPAWIIEEAYRAMKEGYNQYAPMNGARELRHAIRDLYRRFYDVSIDPESELTVTAGATEALYAAITALVDAGDEVILFEPFYDSHQADVLLAGGIPRYVTLRKPEFIFDEEELDACINEKTRLIIVNNPHNPTGKVYSDRELARIAGVACKHDLLVISDEVYEFLTYDNHPHIPMATLPGMRERTITISSTGKTFGMTGWKIGYAVAPGLITEQIQKVHQWITFAVNTPGQHAMAHAMERLEEYLPEFRHEYLRKRDLLFRGLEQTSFSPHLPSGSYFIMADIPSSSDDLTIANELVTEYGVAVIPPSFFYDRSREGTSMIRFCFAKREATLEEGIRRLNLYPHGKK